MVTIKQMALQLGISSSTVSRALRDDETISKETKRIVKALAKELSYEPNPFALLLRNQAPTSIAVLVPQVQHLYFSEMLSAISELASGYGYHLLIYQSNDSYERELAIVNNISRGRIGGLIAVSSKETKDFSHFTKLMEKTPIVFVDRVSDIIEQNTVITDDYGGAFKATEHLITQGYSKIAYLGTEDELLINEVRELGYRDALEQYNIPYKPKAMQCKDSSIEEAEALMLKVLSQPRKERPDAIFANDDLLATGVLLAARKLNISVPNKLGIVGFGDLSYVSWLTPGLTSIIQNGRSVGNNAGGQLLKYIVGETSRLESAIIDTELVIRGSSLRMG